MVARNRAEAASILAAETNTAQDVALDSYRVYVEEGRVLAEAGEVNPGGLTRLLDVLVKRGEMQPPLPAVSKYVDDSYQRAAQSP